MLRTAARPLIISLSHRSVLPSISCLSLCFFLLSLALCLPSSPTCLSLAASQALCENHQSGREQEEQEGDREERRAGERETRSGEHEEEQTTGHQVSNQRQKI